MLASSLVDRSYLGFAADEELAWSVRGPRIQAVLKEVGAEVICLQEDDDHEHFLQALGGGGGGATAGTATAAGTPTAGGTAATATPGDRREGKKFSPTTSSSLPLSPTYMGRWKKRTGADKTDGVSVYWQVQKFELVESEEVEYRVPGCGHLDRDNVALLVVLQEREGGKEGGREGGRQKLIVANTHLLFNPRRGDVKLAQLQLLLARVERLQQRHPGAGIGT